MSREWDRRLSEGAPATPDEIAVGDVVVRLLGDAVRMTLAVTDVSEQLIHCGLWTFDRKTGAEVDDDLGWGPAYGHSGSFLVERVRTERPRQ